MKTKTLAVLILLGFSLFSCEKINDLLTFTINNETEIRVNSSFPINLPFEIRTPNITTNSTEAFENNKTKASLVKDVSLKKLVLTITNPIDKKFSFLKSIHIYISSSDDDEIELAYLDDIPTDVSTITLTPSTMKLDKYITADSYSLRTKVVVRETLTQDIDLNAEMAFEVTASPF